MSSENKYFTSREYKSKNSRTTLFFFPAGFTKLSIYRFTIWQLNKMNIDVVGFDFDWKRATKEADIPLLKKLMSNVDSVVANYIVKKEISEHKFAVFGTSFGGAIALYVAKRHPEINRVILSVPHATMSKVLWTYGPTKAFKERLMNEGVDSEQKLNELIGDVEPQHKLQSMKGKRIVVFTAESDKIVTNGFELVNALAQVEPNTKSHSTRFGHFFGGSISILRKHLWEEILK